MGKLYEESWYQKWQKEENLGKFPKLYRYRYRAVPVQVQGCTGTPPAEANLYRYRSKLYRYTPTKCNLYRYRSEVYQYRCAQNAQNVVFLYN